jgi:Cys-tRNA(Pro)/Cys-tRNA(Cys) deacylase
MTPAVNAAKKARIAYTLHSYTHDPAAASYGAEAADKLGVSPARVFKTLVAQLDAKRFVVAVIPVSDMLSLKHLAEAAGAKKARMADGTDVERISGYVLGGVSPLGQKKRLETFIDASAPAFETIFVSAGRRGLEIELSPEDLRALTGAAFTSLSADG